jgi:hypothetical protein
MRCRRPLILTSAIAVAAVSLLTAGCGGSSSTTPATAAAATQSGALAYARCMRSNGIPTFPDPTSSGAGPNKTAIVSALQAVSSSQAQAAQTACVHVNGGSPGTGQSVAQGPAHTAAMLAFARCMRSRGFPDFPDPTHGQLSPEMVTAAGIDLHQPAVLRAGLACISVTHGALTRANIERAVNGG